MLDKSYNRIISIKSYFLYAEIYANNIYRYIYFRAKFDFQKTNS